MRSVAPVTSRSISDRWNAARRPPIIKNRMLKIENSGEQKPGKGFSYNGATARWWLRRSTDSSHRRAYRTIADFIRASYRRDPKTIVDYACGTGTMLYLLSRRFPDSRLIGLDGSSYLLYAAMRRLSRLPRSCSVRISLIETTLPSPALLSGSADLVMFCFPNMVPSSEDEDEREGQLCLTPDDREIARRIAPEGAGVLEQGRAISYNLRRLLNQGGICVRVEYATVNRHELSPAELRQVAFEEGSLDTDVEGLMPSLWFRVQASAYFRSRVLEDVYQQTGDERDRNGGYLITVLRAV